MDEQGIVIDDLYAFAQPQLPKIQLPNNVHFSPDGSKVLARQVAVSIEKALQRVTLVSYSSSISTNTYVLTFDGPRDTVSPCSSTCPSSPTASPFTDVPHVLPTSTMRNSVP
jgi:hypothetical protein